MDILLTMAKTVQSVCIDRVSPGGHGVHRWRRRFQENDLGAHNSSAYSLPKIQVKQGWPGDIVDWDPFSDCDKTNSLIAMAFGKEVGSGNAS